MKRFLAIQLIFVMLVSICSLVAFANPGTVKIMEVVYEDDFTNTSSLAKWRAVGGSNSVPDINFRPGGRQALEHNGGVGKTVYTGGSGGKVAVQDFEMETTIRINAADAEWFGLFFRGTGIPSTGENGWAMFNGYGIRLNAKAGKLEIIEFYNNDPARVLEQGGNPVEVVVSLTNNVDYPVKISALGENVTVYFGDDVASGIPTLTFKDLAPAAGEFGMYGIWQTGEIGPIKVTVPLSGLVDIGTALTAVSDNAADSYQWHRLNNATDTPDGSTAIAGATSASYSVSKADGGKHIAVAVTAFSTTVTGSAVSIAEAPPVSAEIRRAVYEDSFTNASSLDKWRVVAEDKDRPNLNFRPGDRDALEHKGGVGKSIYTGGAGGKVTLQDFEMETKIMVDTTDKDWFGIFFRGTDISSTEFERWNEFNGYGINLNMNSNKLQIAKFTYGSSESVLQEGGSPVEASVTLTNHVYYDVKIVALGADVTVYFGDDVATGTPTLTFTDPAPAAGEFGIYNVWQTGEIGPIKVTAPLTGMIDVGTPLTAVSETDADSYQWHRLSGATDTPDGSTAIDGATSAAYTATMTDTNKYLTVVLEAYDDTYQSNVIGPIALISDAFSLNSRHTWTHIVHGHKAPGGTYPGNGNYWPDMEAFVKSTRGETPVMVTADPNFDDRRGGAILLNSPNAFSSFSAEYSFAFQQRIGNGNDDPDLKNRESGFIFRCSSFENDYIPSAELLDVSTDMVGYFLIFRNEGDNANVRLYRSGGGNTAPTALHERFALPLFAADAEHDVRIDVEEAAGELHISVYWSGNPDGGISEPFFTVTDSAPLPAGKIGLYQHGWNRVYFADLVMTYIGSYNAPAFYTGYGTSAAAEVKTLAEAKLAGSVTAVAALKRENALAPYFDTMLMAAYNDKDELIAMDISNPAIAVNNEFVEFKTELAADPEVEYIRIFLWEFGTLNPYVEAFELK